jgi:hypothetical protein
MQNASFSLPDNSQSVGDVQRKLSMLGLYHGPRTESLTQLQQALQKFQHRYRKKWPKLPQTGQCDELTWHALNQEAGSLFSEVLQFELDGLQNQHATTPLAEPVRPANKSEVVQRAHDARLCGLAFSGGGIRSATFNLGVLQALAELKLLSRIDYLSTVSGGGFIGSWLCKWIMEAGGEVGAVEQMLTPGSNAEPKKHEPNEIKYLRQYSNYLNPQSGLFSIDSWALLASYIRNTVLNMVLLVAMVALVFCLPGLLTWLVAHYQHSAIWLPLTLCSLAVAVFFSAFSIALLPNPDNRRWLTAQSQSNVLVLVIVPLMLAGFFGSIVLWEWRCPLAHVCANLDVNRALQDLLTPQPAKADRIWQLQQFMAQPHLPNLALPGLLFFMVWLMGWTLAQWLNPQPGPRQPGTKPPGTPRKQQLLLEGLGHLSCSILALGVGTLLTVYALRWFADWQASAKIGAPVIHLVTFGMPVLLCIAGFSMIVLIGLLGRLYTDRSREWWSRQGGWATILVINWVALFGMSLYAPPLLAFIHQHSAGWGNALIASGWLGTTLIGLLAGRAAATGAVKPDPKLALVAQAAPYVFSLGILAAVSMLVHFAVNPDHFAAPDATPQTPLRQFLLDYLTAREQSVLLPQLALLLLSLALALLLAWRLDINKFSLYMIMRIRLVRSFLGASNRKRQAHPFTGFDPADDPPLARLLSTPDGRLQRPYPLINTTLNLVGGKELAWQTRKAGAFLFSPGFCGFELARTPATPNRETLHDAQRGCFRPSHAYGGRGNRASDEDRGTRLGMATAISGAALSNSTGHHGSAPLTFLMTLFNLRLGRWCANPLRSRWQTAGPRMGLACLISELLGLTEATSNYVHLTDGGHFENLGLYELVRRRCRLIVLVDASADGELNFADLGNAIRKCYVDLGVEIDLDVCSIDTKNGFSQQSCVTGKIAYGKADAGAPDGTLLYIKPSLTGKEMADMLNYRKADPSFPYQTRFGQWFDETQFESYRALGYRIAISALKQATEQANSVESPEKAGFIPNLCQVLQEKWGQ